MNKPTSYLAPAYALIFPRIAETVRPLGYAAALHGSMANDIDIVLVPWTDEAATAETVIAEVYRMVTVCFIGEGKLKFYGPTAKPHGRVAWCLPLLAGCNLDISVMPVAAPAQVAGLEDRPGVAVVPDGMVLMPAARDVGRYGDMSPDSFMRVGLDNESDVYVSVWSDDAGGDVEFCTPAMGGGKSPRTREALIALMRAMEADNADTPDRDWWARRNSRKPAASGAQ